MALVQGRANVVLKRFSDVATLFMPMSWIAGLWGMNTGVPGVGTYIGGMVFLVFLLDIF